jgi:hypothetical protein
MHDSSDGSFPPLLRNPGQEKVPPQREFLSTVTFSVFQLFGYWCASKHRLVRAAQRAQDCVWRFL